MNKWVNLDPETREGYSISSNMKEVWAIQLDMFRKLAMLVRRRHVAWRGASSRIYTMG